MDNEDVIYPILLCGGSGSRLWPLSRKSFPKQYLSLNYENDLSLLQETLMRVKDPKIFGNPLIICNQEHRFIAAEQIKQINVNSESIILEPIGKNTAPAVALAALKLIKKNIDPVLLVLSSDHMIKDEEVLIKTIKAAKEYALKNFLVTFGIPPTSAETGYGYIKAKTTLSKEKIVGVDIEKFIEKPCKSLSEQFIKDKRFSWNSGIFMYKASTIINEFEKYLPEIIKIARESLQKSREDLDFIRLEENTFKKCPNISLDHAVMEKTKKGIVLPLNTDWSDIGSWNSLWKYSQKDANGNVMSGDVIEIESKNNLIRSENRLVSTIGIENQIIIETSDVVLIANRKNSQELKFLVENLKNKSRKEAIDNEKVYRPWGNFISLENGINWKVKKIVVNPKESLSLQMHNHRSEHWVVVSGKAEIILDEKTFFLNENQSCYIPAKSKHKLSNKEREPLVIIEVQSGDYLGEDDIVRFEDKYGRKEKY